ncbi:MAG: SAM-dependent methyltransferase [Candidatus Bathyarchaeia archaeon]
MDHRKEQVSLRGKGDFFTRIARRRGYRSRAAFKLIEANRRFSFIGRGDCVVDVGAYPGGWTQVARSVVGDKGYVLALDVKRMEKFPQSNVKLLVGDVTDPTTKARVSRVLPRSADVVISDISPRISGVRELDTELQGDLLEATVEIAKDVLKVGGTVFLKGFQGNRFNGFVDGLKRHFRSIRLFKPKASKQKSGEIYLLARGFER